jgi:hypothetical protein
MTSCTLSGEEPKEKGKTDKQGRVITGQGKDKKIHTWDHTHNEIERFDKNGNHEGAFDPTTGEQVKPADPNKRIDP